MKTAEEIAARIREVEGRDPFGWEMSTLVGYLPWELMQPFLKEGTTREDVGDELLPQPVSPEKVLFDMTDYGSFAWGKVLGHRGISAERSIGHYAAWLWILDDEEAYGWTEDEGLYRPYGAPILAAICRKYNIPIPAGEEAERMSNGQSCSDDCMDGC